MTIKATPVLCSSRLILRPWRDQDSPEFARLNSDPAVTASLAKRPTRWESDALVERIRRHFQEHGFGLWAVEVRDRVPFIGFIGLAVVSFSAHFTPAIEVGWRLAVEHWGHGYASEGARRALAYGFDVLDASQILAFASLYNRRSRAVMERLGMGYNPRDDFDHPALSEGHPLQRHVLYRLNRPQHPASKRQPETPADWKT